MYVKLFALYPPPPAAANRKAFSSRSGRYKFRVKRAFIVGNAFQKSRHHRLQEIHNGNAQVLPTDDGVLPLLTAKAGDEYVENDADNDDDDNNDNDDGDGDDDESDEEGEESAEVLEKQSEYIRFCDGRVTGFHHYGRAFPSCYSEASAASERFSRLFTILFRSPNSTDVTIFLPNLTALWFPSSGT